MCRNSDIKKASTQKFKSDYDIQAKLIYSMIVAGKSANFADKATVAFIRELQIAVGVTGLPLDLLFALDEKQIEECAKKAKTGNYTKIAKACVEIVQKVVAGKMDLMKCKPWDLEEIHGIGKKTSRFFIMWIRPEEEFAALDVHVLRWMRNLGYDAPKSTPSNSKIYEKLEREFIAEAKKKGKTARQLDYEIWVAGARRTQETATPK